MSATSRASCAPGARRSRCGPSTAASTSASPSSTAPSCATCRLPYRPARGAPSWASGSPPRGRGTRGGRPSAPSAPTCSTSSASDPTGCMPPRWLVAPAPRSCCRATARRSWTTTTPPTGTMPDALGLPDGPVVLGVGRLETTKGFDLLVDAVAGIDRELSPTLVIGGDGSQREALRALGEQVGLGDRLRLVGPLDEAGVDTWMRRADVVVMPSRREAFGIVALEAWRAGTPLVATSLGGPASFVTDGVDGVVVDPVNTGALAHAVESLLHDPERRAALGAAGQASARRYTWSAIALQYSHLYQGLASS